MIEPIFLIERMCRDDNAKTSKCESAFWKCGLRSSKCSTKMIPSEERDFTSANSNLSFYKSFIALARQKINSIDIVHFHFVRAYYARLGWKLNISNAHDFLLQTLEKTNYKFTSSNVKLRLSNSNLNLFGFTFIRFGVVVFEFDVRKSEFDSLFLLFLDVRLKRINDEFFQSSNNVIWKCEIGYPKLLFGHRQKLHLCKEYM